MNLLASSALVGHLNGMKANGINIVNAGVLARDAGLTTTARHVASSQNLSFGEDLDKMLVLNVKRAKSCLQLVGNV